MYNVNIMNLEYILLAVAILLAVVGNIPYLYKMYKGEVRPHPYTWFIWSIVSAVTFFGQLQKGGGLGAIPTAASEVFTILIFIFSLRNGFKGIDKKDNYFLFAALLGLIPWALTKDPTLSVITVVTIDVIAFIPTLKKTWQKPESETYILYATNVLRHILTLYLVARWNTATTLHSLAMIVTNTLMTVFILRKKSK